MSSAVYGDETARRFKSSSVTMDRVAADIKLLDKLLTKSSLSQAVKVADSESDSNEKSEAQLYFEKAKKAHQDGDKEAAAEYIRKAKAAMFSSARKAGAKGAGRNKKLERDYKTRIRNVRALLDALKRISQEKKQSTESESIERQILKQIAESETQFKNGKLEEAKKSADATFLLAKEFTISLRDGDTLVRSLHFANKEEEYKYELDRNHTHQMLVTVLLQEKMSNPRIAKKVNKNMVEADSRRKQADAMANKGEFEAAVKTLEESTKYIIRAIRAAGIYIPG